VFTLAFTSNCLLLYQFNPAVKALSKVSSQPAQCYGELPVDDHSVMNGPFSARKRKLGHVDDAAEVEVRIQERRAAPKCS
jgi:hypothetical protein